MIKKRLVIKLSGRIFNIENGDLINTYANFIDDISSSYQLIVITGGGKIARYYIDTARSNNVDESTLDEIGIEISRLNARLLISALPNNVYSHPPKTLQEINDIVNTGITIIAGGLYPGQSTNGTAALIAERIGAVEFLNVTDVDGIYDCDPTKNKHAKKFDQIQINDLRRILIHEKSIAGGYNLMDIISLKIIERSKIKTRILNSNIDDLKKVIAGDKTIGTEIVF